jgi:2'-5' RNA ligase
VITRTQLSLYVPHAAAGAMEAVRALLDPVQASLIPVHITLCREDELEGLDPAILRSRLAAPQARPIRLRFGRPEPFFEHGVLLPCIDGEREFEALRQWVLGSTTIRRQAPHITLAHPRNPKSPHNTPANAALLSSELVIHFATAYRIQQAVAAPWQVLEQYKLAGAG